MKKNNVNLEGLMHEMARRSSEELCPLLVASGSQTVRCLGHACAWWNPHYGACCMGTAYLTQDYIGHMIAQLSDQLRTKEEC